MASIILATDPERRILEASPDLAKSVGSAPRFMAGADCACILRCRNADGEPLCNSFCPALMAMRNRSGIIEGMPIWLESPSGELEPQEATFRRVESVPNGMVVGFFGQPAEQETAPAGEEPAPIRKAAVEPMPRLGRIRQAAGEKPSRRSSQGHQVVGTSSRPSLVALSRTARRRGKL